MKKEEVQECAEELYRNGDFYCSEAVLKSVVEAFGHNIPDCALSMASGFPVGIGGAGCTCGAISGGVMAVGYFFGRADAGDPKVNNCMAISNKLYRRFIAKNRCSCCKILIKGMEKGSPEHMEQCVRFTGEVAADSYELIAEYMNKNK